MAPPDEIVTVYGEIHENVVRCPYCKKLVWSKKQNLSRLTEWVECVACGATGPKRQIGEGVNGWNESAGC